VSKILIRDGAVFAPDGWLEPGYVWIAGESIAAVGAGDPPADLVAQADELISARHKAVLPGLINGHTHLSQTFMRGLSGGRALLPWLKTLIWPLQRALTVADMRLAALLGLVENLRCGVTELVDHHKITATPAHTDAVCEAAAQVGLRFTLARAWSDTGKGAEAPEAILADLARLFERWHAGPIRIANGPLALWRCSAETLQRTHALAQEHGSVSHVHVAESQDEIALSLDAYALRPLRWLDSLGVLDAAMQVVHAVWVEDAEIALLARRGATVVHCPISNAVIGSGIAPVAAMLREGVRLRLGTDGPASNDTQDLFETLKTAVGYARATTLDATVLPPRQALRIAMGAQRVQRVQRAQAAQRALAPGAPADCIVVDLNHPRAAPVHDVDSALVLCTHGSDVETVIVGGRVLMREKRVLVVDEAALLDACRAAVQRLRERAGIEF